nr:polyprotein [Mute swan feces associated hepatovirus 4]
MLRNIAESVGKVVGLLDPEVEDHEMQSDRVGVGGSWNFTSVEQAIITAARMGSLQKEPLPSNLDLPATLETIGEKFYLLQGLDWDNSRTYLEKLVHLDVFAELNSSDFANTGNIHSHRYMQAGVDVIVQANANQFQSGCLMCMLIPGDPDGVSYAGHGMVPHGIINLNMNNSCRLMAPWVYTRGAYNITTPVQAPWYLIVVILEELRVASNANTGCTVSVLARYTDLKLHGIHPVGLMGPQEVRITTSQNVVNLATKRDSSAKLSLALGGESYLGDPSCTGGMFVDNFRLYTATPGFIGRFAFNGSALLTEKIAVIPVNPLFYSTKRDSDWHPHPAASVCQMFAFWRGDPVYYFQVVGTRFHSGRLMIAFIPGNEAINVASLTMKKATSSLCAIMDIQGTSSTCCFRVPFTSDCQYKSTVSVGTQQNESNGARWLSTSLGKIVVFVYSKLRFPNTVVSHVYINVYMCLENAELMCPLYANLGGINAIPTTREIELEACAGDDEAEEKFKETGAFQTPGVIEQNEAKRDFYLDKPENKIPIGAVLSIEEPSMEVAKPQTFRERAPGRRRHTVDHMNMYEYMGRGHIYFSFSLNQAVSGSKKVLTFPLDIRRKSQPTKGFGGTLQWFFSLFHLYQGPLDVTLVFSGSANVDMMVWYTPDGFLTSATWDQQSGNGGLTADYVSGFPFVRLNTLQTSNVQLRIPWYTPLSAISACVSPSCTDTSLGYISLYVNNYTSQDERLGITCYISIPEEARMSVPRPPLRQNLIFPSSSGGLGRGPLGYDIDSAPMGVVETSVDFEPESDPLPVLPARKVLQPMGNLYKDLRINVGAHRLVYAHEELRKAKSSDDLTATAGNLFDDYAIVQRKEGDLLYRGVSHKGKIYYARCTNPPLRAAPLLKSGVIDCVEQDGSWLNLNSSVEAYVFDSFLGAFEEPVKFNWKSFSAGDYVQALGQDVFLRFDTACEGRFMELLKVFGSKSLGTLDRVLMDSEVFTSVTEATRSVRDLASECQVTMKSIKTAITELAKTFAPKKRKVAVKILSILLRTGIKLFVCTRTSWRFDVAAPLLVDLAIDFTETAFDITTLFKSMISDIFGSDELVATSGEWIRNTVGCVSLFKTARDCVTWLIEKFRDWYNENFGHTKQKMDLIAEAEDEIDAMLSYVDEFCSSQQVGPDQVEEGRAVLSQLRTLLSIVNTMPDLKPHTSDLRSAVSLMHNKLRNMPISHADSCLRDEPTVLYLHGPRGCGKSLLAMAVATRLCKLAGFDPKKHIYTKAPVSDYWDGYANQYVCIMDDIGQATNDEDWTNFCQIVSCCPVRLNMPNLEEKGIHFTTPYIICTSNLSDPDPRTIYTKEALERRLHVKIKVLPHRFYITTHGGMQVLDIQQAMRHDAVKDLSCLRMVDEGGIEIKFDQLVERYRTAATNKVKLMHDFIDLWSQSGPDSLAAWFSFRQPKKVQAGIGAQLIRGIQSHKLVIIGTVLATLSSAAIIYAVVKKMQKPASEAAYGQNRVIKNVVRLGEEIQSQSTIDLANLIQGNLMRFGVSTDGETVSWRVNCLQVMDNWCIVPYHACKFDKGVTHFFFLKNGTTYVVRRDRIVEVESQTCPDLLYINVPGMPKGRNLVSHFVKQGDVPACDKRLATLATYNQGLFQIMSEGEVEYKDGITYNHSSPEGKERIFIPKIWRGRGEAAPGTCGGVLISSNTRLGNPFLGIHLAAGGGVLVTALVTQEELECLKGVIPKSSRVTHCVPSSEIVSTSNKSAFVRSEIHDAIPLECGRMPAILFNNTSSELDAVANMFNKYNFPRVAEPQSFSNSVFAVLDCLLDVYGMPKQRQLTESEAINGVPGMDAIPMDTSPGIPYIFKHQRKSDLVRNGEVCDALLRQRIDMHLNDMTFGIACNVVFATYPKDELRKVEKVVKGDTRMIEASPLCFNIAFRRIFGYAVAWLQSNPGWSTGLAVGVDPDKDWDWLFKDALRFGDECICLDYRNFDATTQDFMIKWAIFVIGYLVCVPEPMVNSVGATLAYSKRQVANMLYYVQGSLPSGSPATSIINSVINLCVLTYCFSNTLQISPFEVRRIVKFLVYGDDVVIVWNRKYDKGALDLVTLHGKFAQLGMIITGADKGPVNFVDVLSMRFLKRGVRVGVLGVFQPTIELQTIYSLLQWRRKKARLQDNVDNALWFMFHHGESAFQELRLVVITALQQMGIDIRVPTYLEYEQRFLGIHFRYLVD